MKESRLGSAERASIESPLWDGDPHAYDDETCDRIMSGEFDEAWWEPGGYNFPVAWGCISW